MPILKIQVKLLQCFTNLKAGIARPVSVGKIIKGIRERHPDIIIQYHAHSTPGFSVASALEAARNGVDIIDVGMEPLSWGTGHADLLTIHAMLVDAGFSVPDINMKAYMQVRTLTQEFIDDFLGYYISPKNREMNSLLIGPGLPGGMMGSLMSDLEQNLASLNDWFEKNGKSPITQDELLVKLFDEVQYVLPRFGYPPLVTPFSQYVKNVALMNVIQMEKGKERWSMLDENTWNMLLGQQGQLLGPIDQAIVDLANKQGRTFFKGDPQSLYPDQLDMYRQKMQEKGWETGQDDEELLEYAKQPTQYEAYKSGDAKAKFLEDLAKKRAPSQPIVTSPTPSAMPSQINVDVNGEKYLVKISYPDQSSESQIVDAIEQKPISMSSNGVAKYITSPLEGKFFLTKESSEKGIKKYLLNKAIGLHPSLKMPIKPGVIEKGRIEKYVLRAPFDDAENPYLPHHILWRQKEQFSDGVGYNWIDGFKAYCEAQGSDEQFSKAAAMYPHHTPETKEAFFIREKFASYFTHPQAETTVSKWIPK